MKDEPRAAGGGGGGGVSPNKVIKTWSDLAGVSTDMFSFYSKHNDRKVFSSITDSH